MSPLCRIYTPMNWASIASANVLSLVRRLAIIWTNTDVLSIGPLGPSFSEVWLKKQHFTLFETVVWEIAANFVQGADELMSSVA